MHAKSVSRFRHFSSFSLSFLFPREEISTLSRQASFRRVNSVSTDPRGTVLRLNYSPHARHTAASLSYVSSRVCTTWFRLSEFMTPLIRISRLLVPYVSHLFKNSYRNILWWILHTVARSCCSLRLISRLAHWLTYFDFSRKQTSGFGSFERACSRLHGEVWARVLISTLFSFITDRRKHPSEGGGDAKDQPVFPWGQSMNISNSACRARDWRFIVQTPDGEVLSFSDSNLSVRRWY